MATNMATGINQHRRAIGTFPNRTAAEQALNELRDSGFPMDRVSVVAQDANRDATIAGADVSDRADNKADDGVKVGALSGGALGGLTGLLVGIGALAIPGIGPIMLAGAAATALATTAAGTAIGAAAGSLLGGLIGMGIPEERARAYNDRVSKGAYLVMVDGTDTEIARAATILNHRGIEEWGVYDIPAATGVTAAPVIANQIVETPLDTDTEAVRKFEERRIVDRNNESERSSVPVGAVPVAPPVVPERVLEQPVMTSDAEDIKLYEERLLVDKERAKTGEVAIGKRVETETVRASVPIEKERVVIERTPGSTDTVVAPGTDVFKAETIRTEVYEETPDIRKEAFVREEVNIRKEVDRANVEVEETLRREELDVDVEGRPGVDFRPNDGPNDRH